MIAGVAYFVAWIYMNNLAEKQWEYIHFHHNNTITESMMYEKIERAKKLFIAVPVANPPIFVIDNLDLVEGRSRVAPLPQYIELGFDHISNLTDEELAGLLGQELGHIILYKRHLPVFELGADQEGTKISGKTSLIHWFEHTKRLYQESLAYSQSFPSIFPISTFGDEEVIADIDERLRILQQSQ